MRLPKYIQNIANKSGRTVFVAMSGGVDSSTAAAALADAGFDVVGCFMYVWQPKFLDCGMESERDDAMEVAAELGIPFRTVDLSEEYKSRVVDYMIREYKAGRTPNPDVMCNGEIKFGAFYNWAKEEGANYVATGHYAQQNRLNSDTKLLRGADDKKDQSYFLWQLQQQQLQHTLFPVGHMNKQTVRSAAADYGIPVASKQDSQGLCFLGQIDIQKFLQEFIDTQVGQVVDEDGKVIGQHKGAELYTVGQRRGFTVTDKAPDSGPWYVADKNIANNTIIVTEDNSQTGPVYNGKQIRLTNANWISDAPQAGANYTAQIRYNQSARKCVVDRNKKQGKWVVEFKETLRAVAEGQSCVVYNGDICLGGGIIEKVKSPR